MRKYVPFALERDHAQLNELKAPLADQTIVEPALLDEGRHQLTPNAVLTH